ncbi:MAG: type II secretion system F family protein [Candidatus Pacearchaeota archaeon]|nr:type II secretion system F family protein [Candidatus Pacearchaeota archaeon]
MKIGKIDLEKKNVMGVLAAIIIIIADFAIFWQNPIFWFIFGLAIVIAALPFFISLILESSKEKENNEMFLEFTRNLVESVKAGTPISKSILNLRGRFYGTLTPNVQKLINQISIGIPVPEALEIFARDVNSPVVSRAVSLIGKAEKAGGDIDNILESTAKSVAEVEKLKKERKAAISSLVVQGYVIFLVFIVIMLIMQFKILPMTSEISMSDMGGFSSSAPSQNATAPLLYLLLAQGLFTGLVIGKLAEGSIKAGIKHSFIMLALSILIYTGANAFF